MSDPVNGGRPLNEAQSGVWYAQRMDPLNPVFNMGVIWRSTVPPIRNSSRRR